MGSLSLFFYLLLIMHYLISLSVSSSSSDEHVEGPSWQLEVHHIVYKPAEFNIHAEHMSHGLVLVSFNYTKIDLYDRYIFRIRYHGYNEYATNVVKLNRTGRNELLMRDFLDASYIVCVTLFSSIRSNKYPPLSTTGMCVDVTVGEPHPIGGSHSSTGLLAPLLLAVAAVLLLIITVISYFKKKRLLQYLARRAQYIRQYKRNRKRMNKFISINMENDNTKSKIKIVNDDEPEEDGDESGKHVKWNSMPSDENINDKNSYQDFSFMNPSFLNDDNKIDPNHVKDCYYYNGVLSSLESLSHLLNDKPWLRYGNTSASKIQNKTNNNNSSNSVNTLITQQKTMF